MIRILKEKFTFFKNRRNDLFKEFVESEKSSGYILVILTAVSLLLANSVTGESYIKLWHTFINLSFFNVQLNLSLEHWINDGLMVIFFLLVGLEIGREIYIGELSSVKKASLPAIAALGGMIVPAVLYIAFNAGTPYQRGFGIPMATDIAFTLGVLSLLGNRIPISLKVFITALAIMDDLGAIIIIAIFYSSNLSLLYLFSSIGVFIVLLIMNKLNIFRLTPYIILGIVMWYFMMKSGVHSTISGVLLAFAIPFRKNDKDNLSYILQKRLHKLVAFIILPLFALANTAILLPNDLLASLYASNSIGIILGLVIGKPLGIFIFSLAAVKTRIGLLSKDINWPLIFGASSLAGIGFTMSIFITNLAFNDASIISASKLSIILASTISALIGLFILKRAVAIKRNS